MKDQGISVSEKVDDLCRNYLVKGGVNLISLVADKALGKLCIISSFGAESVVLLHLVSSARPGIPVIFIDTDKHFSETISYKQKLTEILPIKIQNVHPEHADVSAYDQDGELYSSDPDLCCHLRKVKPFNKALKEFESYFTGRKRYQTNTREDLQIVEAKGNHVVINPLACWTADMISDYIHRFKLPIHPLISSGYRSIGCHCCTRSLSPEESDRAGRWSHCPAKNECGIHFEGS